MDLKKLENISTNRIAEELKETIAKKDVKYSRKLNEWDVSSCGVKPCRPLLNPSDLSVPPWMFRSV